MNGTFHKVSLPACAAIGALLAASSSWAAGFALRDQSASGLGTAFAGGTAGATDDASGIFFNPAVIGLLPGSEVSASATFIAPQSKLHDGRAARAAALGGSTISGPSSTGDAAEDALVPAGYGVWAASPDLRFGLAVTSPWGLVTEYDDNWIGRYHGIHSELLTVNVNPVVAYRLAPRLTVAGGVQVQYATADLSQAVDVGGILAAMGLGTVPGSMDAQARIEG
ncbi:MAG TPA: outer membrane protein transport protein, partial [Azospirillaceae bacterium]|nr:outer membrane protein transport protein [Azospirillaceae bacterium]